MASEHCGKANDRWLLGFGTACWILARFPSGMGARGLMAEAKVTVDDLRTAGMMEQEIAEIERASK